MVVQPIDDDHTIAVRSTAVASLAWLEGPIPTKILKMVNHTFLLLDITIRVALLACTS